MGWSSSDKDEFYRNPRKIHHTYNKLQFGPLLVRRQDGDTTDQNNAESKASDFEAQTSKTLSRPSYPAGGDPPRTVIRIPFSRAGDRAASPSVNKILRETMSEENKMVLLNWEKRMINQLGEEGFKNYQQLTFARGKAIHSWLEDFLLTATQPATRPKDEVTLRHIQSIGHILPSISDVRVIESAAHHPKLDYCGIIDCVARIGDTLCLIDWKTSEKVKPTIQSLYDNPLQIVAYLGAINSDPEYASLKGLCEGAVVVLYNSGYSANVHKLPRETVKKFWKIWLERLQRYKNLARDS